MRGREDFLRLRGFGRSLRGLIGLAFQSAEPVGYGGGHEVSHRDPPRLWAPLYVRRLPPAVALVGDREHGHALDEVLDSREWAAGKRSSSLGLVGAVGCGMVLLPASPKCPGLARNRWMRANAFHVCLAAVRAPARPLDLVGLSASAVTLLSALRLPARLELAGLGVATPAESSDQLIDDVR